MATVLAHAQGVSFVSAQVGAVHVVLSNWVVDRIGRVGNLNVGCKKLAG